jgi:deazaflavin-dependent oxidoreductase (nitroreductase family)
MQSDFLYRWLLNPMMKAILKSPLHRLVSGTMMLITFTGRKSGRQYTTPVGYVRNGDAVICLTHANWWKNLRGGAKVSLRIQGHDYDGVAEPVSEETTRIANGIRQFLHQVPSWGRFYDVSIDEDGTPNSKDVARAAESAILIEIQLQAA